VFVVVLLNGRISLSTPKIHKYMNIYYKNNSLNNKSQYDIKAGTFIYYVKVPIVQFAC